MEQEENPVLEIRYDLQQQTGKQGEDCPAAGDGKDVATEEEEVIMLDGSMAVVPPPTGQEAVRDPALCQEQLDGSIAVAPPLPGKADPRAGEEFRQSPAPSLQSGASGETEENLGSPSFEEPLTPVTDNSSTSKSQPGSGRVTPASQSDQSLYMSSSEKSGTPQRNRRLTDGGVRQIDFDNQSSSSGSIRNVRFPLRPGISWRKGERLEAMDYMHKWFPAKIREINEEDLTVLIHFDGWNQRFDEWVDMASDRIRPLIRHSERKVKAKRFNPIEGEYRVGEQVYAKWTDCKMYPAKITGIMPNGSYEVIFYDGFKKQVQPINVRPMPGEMKAKYVEVSPVLVSAPKRQKVRRESGTATSPTDPQATATSPPDQKVKKEARSRSRSTGKQRSRKNKVIPMDQFVSKEILFKDDGTGPTMEDPAAAGLGIKSEPVSTQTDYSEHKQMEIKQEPGSFDIPATVVTVSETLPAETVSARPPEKVFLHGPPVVPKKAFVVESDHNRYKCHFEGCNKGFRKEHLLEYHIKYYHIDGADQPPPPQPQKRRRKTTSICSTESDSTPSAKKWKGKPRHGSADSLSLREVKAEMKEEIDAVTLALLTGRPLKQETGEISTQTTLVRPEASDESLRADMESLHQRTMSQDSALTEESSVTDVEDYLKPDELVNCICDYYEENGLMIQCEVCLCWQHANCFGITERTLPKTYVCFVCENPPGVRESSRYIHEQDWLKCGEIAAFNYLPNVNASEERCAAIKQTHSLMAEVHQLNTVMHSLKLQLKVLKTKDEQKLKLWRMDWDVTETFQDDDTAPTFGDMTSNDHSVMGPGTIPDGTTEQQPTRVVFTLHTGEDRVENPETLNNGTETKTTSEYKTTNGREDTCKVGEGEAATKPDDRDGPGRTATMTAAVDGVDVCKDMAEEKKGEMAALPATDSATDITNQMMSPLREEKDQEEGTHSDSTESVVEDPIEMYERNLLNHVQRVQAEISDRMDAIEEQLAVLESQEALGSRKGPSASEDITADVPHLKRTMRHLHHDLFKVKKMAVFH